MRFKREETRLLEPFAVCGILFGLGVIGLRILVVVSSLSKETYIGLFKASVIVSATAGLIYAAFSLREKLKGSVPDRVLYVVVISIFGGLIVGASLLM